MRSKYTKRREQKGQRGGLRVTNIITEENKHNYVGRLVRVIALPWMPRDLYDENNFFYVRDTLHNIGPEYLEGEIWDNSFVKAGTIIEMTEEEGGATKVQYSEEFVIPGTNDLNALEAWGYKNPILLKAGRCTHVMPDDIEGDEDR